MNKKQFSNRTISTFEIVGAFIVDLYYNHFYQEAKRLRMVGKADSVTEGYKHVVGIYIMSLNNPESYKKTIVGLHKYYYTTTRYTGISFSDCINEIVSHFIPDDFFESTTNIQRDGILKQVLSQSVKQFSSDILCSELLHTIIDKHNDKNLIRKLQDKMLLALMHERELLFQKFFKGSNRSNTDVNYEMINKLKSEIIKLVKNNTKLNNDNKKLELEIQKLKKNINTNIIQNQKTELSTSDEDNVTNYTRENYTRDVNQNSLFGRRNPIHFRNTDRQSDFQKPTQVSSVTEKPTQVSSVTEKPTQVSSVTEKPTQVSNITEKPTQVSSVTEKPTQVSNVKKPLFKQNKTQNITPQTKQQTIISEKPQITKTIDQSSLVDKKNEKDLDINIETEPFVASPSNSPILSNEPSPKNFLTNSLLKTQEEDTHSPTNSPVDSPTVSPVDSPKESIVRKSNSNFFGFDL